MEIDVIIRKDILRDFLGYIFECDASGAFLVSHSHPAGKLLCSLVEYTYKPVAPAAGASRLILPSCRSLSTARGRFVYVSKENQEKFNDYLEAIFDLDFNRFYMAGQRLGFRQKDVLYSYINSRRLESAGQDQEMLKKRGYRQSVRDMNARCKKLANRVQYINRQIASDLKNIS